MGGDRTLFDNAPEAPAEMRPGTHLLAAFGLWFKGTANTRPSWELVHVGTEGECVAAIGCGNRRGGRWLVLPAGREP